MLFLHHPFLTLFAVIIMSGLVDSSMQRYFDYKVKKYKKKS